MAQKKEAEKQLVKEVAEPKLDNKLREMIEETAKATPGENRDKVKRVVGEMLKKEKMFSKRSLQECDLWLDEIDKALSGFVSQVLHDPSFQRLEGAWRGLQHLVERSELGSDLRLQVLDLSRDELVEDLNSGDFMRTAIFDKVYRKRFDVLGEVPLGSIVGDFEFSHASTDVRALTNMAKIAAASHCPFLTAPAPSAFGIPADKGWDALELMDNVTIENRFLGPTNKEMTEWRKLRQMEDSRYIAMCMPRVLARQAYGNSATERACRDFDFQEFELDADGFPKEQPSSKYCWMSAAYALAGCMAEANFYHGWPVAIRGVESGGRVDSLPMHLVKSGGRGKKIQCPTEVSLNMTQDTILGAAGFLPLIFEKNTNHAAFIGAQTVNLPKTYTDDLRGTEANASANLSSRLPMMLAVSKAAHVMQRMLRYQLGKSREADEIEKFLQDWFVNNFVTNAKAEEARALKPFAAAEIKVVADEGNPGVYFVTCRLRPHYQVESFDVGISLVGKV